MSDIIRTEKELSRKENLLENYLNSKADDNIIISRLELNKRKDESGYVLRCLVECVISEDDLDMLMRKIES
jgi:hypothetical protein